MARRKIITLKDSHLDSLKSFKEHLHNELSVKPHVTKYNSMPSSLLAREMVDRYIYGNKKKHKKRYSSYDYWDGSPNDDSAWDYDDDYGYSSGSYNNDYDYDDDYGYDEYDTYGCVDIQTKYIVYYRDINNPEDIEEFFNLYSFDKFLESEGIDMSETEYNGLMNRYTTHCCLNPKERLDNGKLMLMTADTYGNLRWDYLESEDSSESAEITNTVSK